MWTVPLVFLTLLYPQLSGLTTAQVTSPAAIASEYSLTTSTSLPFPTATLASSDAQAFLVSNWHLSRGRIQDGPADLSFVSDPFANSSSSASASTSASAIFPSLGLSAARSSPVLQVTYPSGSYSHDTGGAQLYSLWNASGSGQFHSMLLTYEVAFDADFDWVKGGKLPGFRGGPDPDRCSGGSPANGSNCFSARVMWRTQAAGEVYAYFLEPSDVCDNPNFICNSDDYGTSIDRGSFSFVAGQWNKITLLVRLNNPPSSANGQVALYYNDVKALDQRNLQYRNSSDIDIGGLYFSTFFGGNNTSWATPKTVHTYFRNFEMWGSTAASNLTAATRSTRSPAPRARDRGWLAVLLGVLAPVLGALL